MSILLVEDDQFKEELLEGALLEALPGIEIVAARSVQQAVRLVRDFEYEYIVLDIALPSHDSRPGAAQPISQLSGGVEVLLELSYEARPDRVIIVTQYPEIEFNGHLHPLEAFQHATSAMMSANIIDVIYFQPQDPSWVARLKRAVR